MFRNMITGRRTLWVHSDLVVTRNFNGVRRNEEAKKCDKEKCESRGKMNSKKSHQIKWVGSNVIVKCFQSCVRSASLLDRSTDNGFGFGLIQFHRRLLAGKNDIGSGWHRFSTEKALRSVNRPKFATYKCENHSGLNKTETELSRAKCFPSACVFGALSNRGDEIYSKHFRKQCVGWTFYWFYTLMALPSQFVAYLILSTHGEHSESILESILDWLRIAQHLTHLPTHPHLN